MRLFTKNVDGHRDVVFTDHTYPVGTSAQCWTKAAARSAPAHDRERICCCVRRLRPDSVHILTSKRGSAKAHRVHARKAPPTSSLPRCWRPKPICSNDRRSQDESPSWLKTMHAHRALVASRYDRSGPSVCTLTGTDGSRSRSHRRVDIAPSRSARAQPLRWTRWTASSPGP
jgi:hypothetical protein